jgi:acyl-CoA reductase-like NAD-dependent aldehyde dehydrogenase
VYLKTPFKMMAFQQGPNGENILPVRINGVAEPVDAARLIPVIGAKLGGKIVHYAQSATPELAIKAAEVSLQAFESWRQTTHLVRRELLIRAADTLEARTPDFVAAQVEETSCVEGWAAFNVQLTVRAIREIAYSIAQASTGELPPLEAPGAQALVYQEPVGPVLAISPWNGAVILSGRALAAPIAAGCSVVFKASELSPRVHHLLVDVFEAAGSPQGLISVVQASREDAPAVTEALISHPAIRKIEFTGSAKVGSIIGRLSFQHLKPVLLELGGKAPAVVLPDADPAAAAQKIADGALLHHGQICMSTDRIVVVRSVADELIRELRTYIEAKYSNDKGGAGHAVTKEHCQRVQKLLQDAHAKGAEYIVGDASLRDDTGASLTPTIITNVKSTDALFHEEIFGPAAILTVVEDVDEAVKVANATSYGLNAAVHGRDALAALRVARRIEAGQVHIGSITEYDEPTIPIGGVKGSGWGRNNGKYALREFLVEKTITIHDGNYQFGGL